MGFIWDAVAPLIGFVLFLALAVVLIFIGYLFRDLYLWLKNNVRDDGVIFQLLLRLGQNDAKRFLISIPNVLSKKEYEAAVDSYFSQLSASWSWNVKAKFKNYHRDPYSLGWFREFANQGKAKTIDTQSAREFTHACYEDGWSTRSEQINDTA